MFVSSCRISCLSSFSTTVVSIRECVSSISVSTVWFLLSSKFICCSSSVFPSIAYSVADCKRKIDVCMFSRADAQTWLSTALTNLETCRAGFYELGVQDYVLPLMSNNVTKLLSNTLALTKVEYKEPSNKDGFPTWVKPSGQPLLVSQKSYKS